MKQSDVDQLIAALKPVFSTKEDLKALDKKITKLDAKQENMDIKLDAFLGEISDSRDEQELQAGNISEHSDQLEDHEQRIDNLEKVVPPAIQTV